MQSGGREIEMQVNRLFEIVYQLLNEKSITAERFSNHFEVSTRTIYRDVEVLSSAGIPIYMKKGKGGGISLLPEFVLNKTVLTDSEKSDILASLQAMQAVCLEKTGTASKKLTSMFGKGNDDWIEIDFSDWVNPEEEAKAFKLLKNAIINKNLVDFNYSSKGKSLYRTVEPLKLCFKSNNWYLYAYCKLRKNYRFFKLRRIKQIQILSEKFERKIPENIFSEKKAFDDELISITLKLKKEIAYRVYDEFSEYEVCADGSFIVKATIPKGEWIYRYIASFGEYCIVLSPLEVQLEIKEMLQKTLEQYL